MNRKKYIVVALLIAILLVGGFVYFVVNNSATAVPVVASAERADSVKQEASSAEKPSLQGLILEDINGKPFNFSTLNGKKVYIKMWASWCHVCLAGLPETEQLSADQNKNYAVVTVVFPNQFGEKNEAAFRSWYKELGYHNMIVLFDKQGILQKMTNLRVFPSALFVDENLTPRFVVPGQLTKTQIDTYMEKVK